MQKRVNFVDFAKSFQTSIYYLVLFSLVSIYYLVFTCKIGFDTAENELSNICSFFLNDVSPARWETRQ